MACCIERMTGTSWSMLYGLSMSSSSGCISGYAAADSRVKIMSASAASAVMAISTMRRLVCLRGVGGARLYSSQTIRSHAEKSVNA